MTADEKPCDGRFKEHGKFSQGKRTCLPEAGHRAKYAFIWLKLQLGQAEQKFMLGFEVGSTQNIHESKGLFLQSQACLLTSELSKICTTKISD